MVRPSQQDVLIQMDYERRRIAAVIVVKHGVMSVETAAQTYDIAVSIILADIRHSQAIDDEFGKEPF